MEYLQGYPEQILSQLDVATVPEALRINIYSSAP